MYSITSSLFWIRPKTPGCKFYHSNNVLSDQYRIKSHEVKITFFILQPVYKQSIRQRGTSIDNEFYPYEYSSFRPWIYTSLGSNVIVSLGWNQE